MDDNDVEIGSSEGAQRLADALDSDAKSSRLQAAIDGRRRSEEELRNKGK